MSVNPLDRKVRGFDDYRRGLVNDWLNEAGDPLTDLDQNVIVRREGDTEIRLIEQSGSYRPRTGRGFDNGKLLSGWVRIGDEAWEVRLTGQPEQVDAQREAFLRWLDTVTVDEREPRVDEPPAQPRMEDPPEGDLPSPPAPR